MPRNEVAADAVVLGGNLFLAQRGNVVQQLERAAAGRVTCLPPEMERPKNDT
ncbi:hypothetical protein [Croceibacterium selenioxidans]|uniref:hypothetical protein n=1 Tax=Croceibacterium selenioxidans TaxID=2838833 RepID=UPI0020323F4F|nr:hypothetical protein [Croceibacterium selenioxidans]